MEIAQNRDSMKKRERMSTKRHRAKETTRTDKIESSSSFSEVLSHLPVIYVRNKRCKDNSREWIRISALSHESVWIQSKQSSIFKGSDESNWSVMVVSDCSKWELDFEREKEREEEWKVVDSWRIWEMVSLESATRADWISESWVNWAHRENYKSSGEQKRRRRDGGELNDSVNHISTIQLGNTPLMPARQVFHF